MKHVFIVLFFVVLMSELFAQSNSIVITYTPALTKLRMTDVKPFGDNVFTDFYKVWYDTQKPTESVYGYNLGFNYKRKIKTQFSLEFGVFYTILKANSGNFFQVNGLKEYHPNYGGIEYNLTYLGLEAPINLYYQVYKKEKITLELNTGVSFNLMGQFSVEHHLIEKASGIKYKTGSFLYISDPRLDAYLTKFDEKRHQRIGICLGLKLNYQLHKYLTISISPIIKYYSNALEKSYSVDALRADAFLLGLQSQINFNF